MIDAENAPDAAASTEFCKQLEAVRVDMLEYARVLAQIADVEELT